MSPSGGTSVIVGREMAGIGGEWIEVSPERCFFFGCGSSGLFERCFDRTGTAFVDVRAVTREESGTVECGAGGGG